MERRSSWRGAEHCAPAHRPDAEAPGGVVTVLPFRPRPRGRRKIAPARFRAARDPYSGEHRRRRKVLMAALAAAGGWQCPGGCGRMLYAWQGRAIHLHHGGGLAAKLAGLPGDTL